MHFELIDFTISFCLLLGAILYTSVGHAGASIYIAIMTLFNIPSSVIKPTALVLNIFIASFTSWRFIRKGFFDLKVLLPIALGAIPFAFLGGYINPPSHIYKSIVGFILLISAISLVTDLSKKIDKNLKKPPFFLAVLIGSCIGFLAGLTGTGGGIFLSPLILFLGWSSTKTTSGITALFILINSSFGLLGNYSSIQSLPNQLPLFIGATLIGALIGTTLGIKFYTANTIKKTLALVLVIAGLKLLLT
ncbi:sulfite exporter TauE/SafE family protein [Candidatus Methylopumilus rimovensis]|uniref:Probable membrane transporter protein n=1 Tax=Candidatus Methylopumilus rimovensis TaxID=2588535 RepID=A0AAE6FSZ4_9PROT|nr:sulfite exporter TauE/SafE family protein [Candidatus Methylopumilus rimovensis]QDD13639.1 sulfite exporter TauE/SafE family protein [Candidatus Methylopumilus rimovensis]